MKCFTRKVFAKYKSHNLTQKHFSDFKNDITKYLSPTQIANLKCTKNDMIKYKKKRNINYNSSILKLIQLYEPRQHPRILSNIMKHVKHPKNVLFKTDTEEFYSITTNYPTYYYKRNDTIYTVLDINKLSKGFDHFEIGQVAMNGSSQYIIFNVDFIGNRVFHLFLKHIYCDEIIELRNYDPKKRMISVHETLNQTPNNSNFFIWLDDSNIVYSINNSSYNTNKTYVYNIHSHDNKLIYKNKNTFIEVKNTNDYSVLYDSDYNSDEIYLLSHDYTINCLIKRKKDTCYPYVEHLDGIWYIREQNKGNDIIKTTQNFKTFKILYENNDPCVQIVQMETYLNHVYFILSDNSIYRLGDKLEIILHGDSIYYFRFGFIQCKTLEIIRHSYLSTPYIQYYNTETKHMSPYKTPASPYIEKDVFIHPMLYFTLMYKKGHSIKQSKCILYGYGSYGDTFDRGYLPFIFELLDKGFIVVFAHIRGGGEFGFKGYDEGRLLNKKNTFYDFIDIIKYLYKHKYTTKDLLTIWGRSAGGLLIASVLNIEPDICHLAILGVPFVTPILTMTHMHNPLGFESHSEFGNPFIKSHLKYLESYDPLSHIASDGKYPNIFIYTNLNDTLVPYKEPLLYYEALKKVNVFKENKRTLTLHFDKLHGHTQGSSVESIQESFSQIIGVIYKHYKIEL